MSLMLEVGGSVRWVEADDKRCVELCHEVAESQELVGIAIVYNALCIPDD